MINWYAASKMLTYICQNGQHLSDTIDKSLSKWPKFQNISYPVTPLPLFLSAQGLDRHRSMVERYVELLEKVLVLYKEHQEIRDYFGLKPEEDALVQIDCGFKPLIRVCRLDGYFAIEDGSLKILEHNTDCPAGILFTPRLNSFVDKVIYEGLQTQSIQIRQVQLDNTDATLQQFLDTYRKYNGTQEHPRLAILQLRGKSNVESQEMAQEFTQRGTPTVVIDPREMTFTQTGAEVDGQPIHIVWNKINTCFLDWNDLCTKNPNLLNDWMEAISSKKICHVNSFAARYVTESKLCISFFQEPEHQNLFTEEEHALIQSLLPWSRKLELGKQVLYKDKNWDLKELLHEWQAEFVLKQPYDIRGSGVTIGRSVDRETWLQQVDIGFRKDFAVQSYIRPTSYPVIASLKTSSILPMSISIDSFMFGGKLVGFGSKASLEDKVNLFQRGRKLAVRVVETVG